MIGDQSQADPLEEKTCSQCGRPNLLEALKCWFCQTLFESENVEKERIDEFSEKENNKNKNFPNQEQAQIDENIPDWLKKVRALKAADQPEEEKKPDWEQSDLFPTADESKKRSPKKTPRKKEKKKTVPIKTPDQKKPAHVKGKGSPQGHEDPGSMTSQEEIDEPGTLSDELPKGFTKF